MDSATVSLYTKIKLSSFAVSTFTLRRQRAFLFFWSRRREVKRTWQLIVNAIETREKQQQNSSHLLLCNGTEGYTNNNNNKNFKKKDHFFKTFLSNWVWSNKLDREILRTHPPPSTLIYLIQTGVFSRI